MKITTKDDNSQSQALFETYSDQLRQHREIWELCHARNCHHEFQDIFSLYGEEKELMAIIAAISANNPLAWSHATAIAALSYIIVREQKLSLIEAQEAFLSGLLKMAGVAGDNITINNVGTGDQPKSQRRVFLYPDVMYSSSEKLAYCGFLREVLYDVPGLSINVFRLLDLAVDANMLNEDEAKATGASASQKIVMACNDLLTTYLLLPKKMQTMSALITLGNAQGLFRFGATYQQIYRLFKTLPAHKERFPPGPADIEKRLVSLDDNRSELTKNVRKMLSIVADLKALIKHGQSPAMSKIPYRLWLITNSSGILSTASVSPLWDSYDLLTGKVQQPDLDKSALAFKVAGSLNEVELLQWLVRQHLSAHAYALHTYLAAKKGDIYRQSESLFVQINQYLEVFDLAVNVDDTPVKRAPTLIDSVDVAEVASPVAEDEDEFVLFSLNKK